MSFKFESTLDALGIKILRELQHDARISFSELGRRVGLSSPAVAERVKKMEEAGIIDVTINGHSAERTAARDDAGGFAT